MTTNRITVFRMISVILFTLTSVLFIIDLFLHSDDRFDGIGLVSTLILPPIGFLLAGAAFKKTGSKKDVLLLILNGIAFLTMFFIMTVGTWLFGP
ncbi:hypothetical protein ACE41H_17770 [Paenibacillus enshidis]|uniref:DUF3953 domain-containing protein n=1 Tax=Paenibacillus enshidis TaxID=1458439 RepID=A0ABV5AWQ6_9BACL